MAVTTLTLPNLAFSKAEQAADDLEQSLSAPLAVALNETDESRGLWNVVAYYATSLAAEAASQTVDNDGFRIESIPNTGWIEKSLAALPPIAAGRFQLHGAHDRYRRRAGGIALEIDAGTAFGTGHHATTMGCLLAFERVLKRRRPRQILDVGTGSGVLALAAAKATRRWVVASDIDPEAVRVTRHNAEANAAKPWIKAVSAAGLRHPVIVRQAPYDVIFANILARPLIALAQDMSQALAPGGRLILSGLTSEQMRFVLAAYRSRGLVFESCLPLDQWRTLTLARPSKRPGRKGAGRFQNVVG
jgi:ribosomal protein L11 methyltransferase